MPEQEDIDYQKTLLKSFRLTLHHYLNQQALLGKAFAPPQTTHGIREAREGICRAKQTLRLWGIEVEHLPDDEEEYQLDNPDIPFEKIDMSLFPCPKFTYLDESAMIKQRYPLHIVWMIDASVSMTENGKIQALNTAVCEMIPHLEQVALENPYCEIFVSCLKYSHGAEWYIHRNTPLKELKWINIEVARPTAEHTDLGAAINLVSSFLSIPPMPHSAYSPLLILISDGHPTDNYIKSLQNLFSIPWGYLATRISVGIGKDANHQVLDQFCSPEMKTLTANNIDVFIKYIKLAPLCIDIDQEEKSNTGFDEDVW